jgi:hypothetical protein
MERFDRVEHHTPAPYLRVIVARGSGCLRQNIQRINGTPANQHRKVEMNAGRIATAGTVVRTAHVTN